MKIQYTGPYLKVTAEGYAFIRNVSVEIADDDVCARLLGAKINGVNLFIEEIAPGN